MYLSRLNGGLKMPENCTELCKITPVLLHSNYSNIPVVAQPIPTQATNDVHLINLWLHGRSPGTQKVYQIDIQRFLKFVRNKSLHQMTLGDIQAFADSLVAEGLKATTQHRILAALKSLFSFGHKLGYLPYDIARPLKTPKFKDTLAERILSETEVQRIIGMETNERNQLLLRILYAGGIRVAELSKLAWNDLQERENGGQMVVYGKGQKTHTVLIPNPLWNDLIQFRQNAIETDPVFKSRKGGKLHPSQILRIVRKATRRAGIKKQVSPHWFRHAHASHALDHGAPIHLVQSTLSHSSIATTGKYTHARPNESSSTYLTV
jgi:integrase/recombinase XerD